MKKVILGLVIALSTASFAQDLKVPSTLTVNEGSYRLEDAPRNGFQLEIQGEQKEVLKAYKSYLSEAYGFKLNKSGGDELTNSKISSGIFSIRFSGEQSADVVVLKTWLIMGSVYASRSANTQESAGVEAMLKGFAKKYYTEKVTEKIEDSEKEIKGAIKTVVGLEKDKSGLNKSVVKAEKAMAKAKAKIEKNNAKIATIQAANEELAKVDSEQTNTITELKTQTEATALKIKESNATLTKLKAAKQLLENNLSKAKSL